MSNRPVRLRRIQDEKASYDVVGMPICVGYNYPDNPQATFMPEYVKGYRDTDLRRTVGYVAAGRPPAEGGAPNRERDDLFESTERVLAAIQTTLESVGADTELEAQVLEFPRSGLSSPEQPGEPIAA